MNPMLRCIGPPRSFEKLRCPPHPESAASALAAMSLIWSCNFVMRNIFAGPGTLVLPLVCVRAACLQLGGIPDAHERDRNELDRDRPDNARLVADHTRLDVIRVNYGKTCRKKSAATQIELNALRRSRKCGRGSWRPGEGKTRYPRARKGEVMLDAKNKDPIAPKIGRGCPLFGRNLLFKVCNTKN